ncbi:Transcription factor WhiB [uncultured Caudovirales phage]|uniref:Transcription factor WhiB n=1 Tax=uncultured Caudovirales phage TaxID=2100421 RepID=A0A6J5KS29_9CAUD|nr:Transcription factor WhiB [uncultured Caudovirales phage]
MDVQDLNLEIAACRDEDPDMFFPDNTNKYGVNSTAGKKVCANCPIEFECLQVALDNEYEGIWGGTTLSERQVLLRKPRRRMSEAAFTALQQVNRANSLKSSAKAVAKIQDALNKVEGNVPTTLLDAAMLRVSHPTATLSELADIAGVTKDSFAGHLRRFMQLNK